MLQLNRDTIERTSKAISNIRLIASRVKRAKVQDAAQKCEQVVFTLDLFRKYAAMNEGKDIPQDTACTLKHRTDTLALFDAAVIAAHEIYMMLTNEKRRSYRDEYHQAELLFSDIMRYFENITGSR